MLNNNNRGFTLIEMIIVVAILAITASIAIPAMQSFIIKSQVRSFSSDLSRSLWQARNHALSYGKTISLCGRDATATPASCHASGSWANGWITYMALPASAPTASNTLAVVTKSTGTIIASSAATRLSFAPNGLVTQVAAGAGAANTLMITCNNASATVWRTLHIQRNGRIRIELNKDDVYAC